MIGNKEVFTVGEVALLNDIPKKCVYLAIHRGELGAVRFNARTVRVQRHALEAWLAQCRRRAKEPVGRTGTTGT